MNDAEALKKIAGEAACEFVKTGMRVGLGTGSTVKYTVLELGRRIAQEGLEIVGVPTSVATENLATKVGIPLVELGSLDGLDIVIDGTDEFDPSFQLIKGGGAACFERKLWLNNRLPWSLLLTIESKFIVWEHSVFQSKLLPSLLM